MSLAKRISEHPWLTLTVSAASILSTIVAVAAFLTPARPAGNAEPGAADAVAAQSELVGTWRLETPPDLGWTVTYRANGSFTLVLPTGPVEGFYEAANGVFSSRSPATESSDQGTYVLLSPTRLEMTGELGVSVWEKVE